MPARLRDKRRSCADAMIVACGTLIASRRRRRRSGGPVTDPDTPEARGGAAAVPMGGAAHGRGGLDAPRIIGAGVRFIDENGLRMLTMQRLGGYLGVEGMSLYRYVPGREALLDGVVEAVVDELYGDPDVFLEPTHGWQDYLQRLRPGGR